MPVEDAPDRAADEGKQDNEQDDEIVIGGVAGTVGEDGDGFVQEGLGQPGDKAVKGLEPPIIAVIVGKREDPIGVREDIAEEEDTIEAEAQGLCERPIRGRSHGRRWEGLFHVWGFGKR